MIEITELILQALDKPKKATGTLIYLSGASPTSDAT
jgi:hypothetical protein